MAADRKHDQNSDNAYPTAQGVASLEGHIEADRIQEDWTSAKRYALDLCEAGRYLEAEKMYRQLIAEGLHDASVYCNLGNLCRLNGNKEEGLALLYQSIECDPDYVNGLLNLGVAYQQDGNLKKSISFYRKAQALDDKLVAVHHNQGVAWNSLGKCSAAFKCFKRSFELSPKEPEWLLIAARSNKTLYRDLITIYQKHLDVAPNDTATARCLSAALRESGSPESAAIQNTLSLAVSPDCVVLWLEQAACLQDLGETDQAMAACEKALSLEPDSHEAHFMMGNCFRKKGMIFEAERETQAAVTLNPNYPEALTNLAVHKRAQGYLETAIEMFKAAIRFQPLYTQAIHPQAWQGLIFSYSIGGSKYVDVLSETYKMFWGLPDHAEILLAQSKLNNLSRGQGEKARLGILSSEIGHHVVSSFLDSFLSNYSKDKFEIEVVVPFKRPEASASELARKADNFLSLEQMDDEEISELLFSRSYDILIETSGHTESNSLRHLTRRFAPVQCHYIGFHASTGLGTIDYIIADNEVLPSGLDPCFSETPWRLDRTWLACTPYEDLPDVSSTTTSSSPVFGFFGQIAKVREETLDYWGGAMRAVPTASLVIKDQNTVFECVRERILLALEAHGVSSHRISFLPWTKTWQEHMRCHNQIDIALDATPWSSSTTAFNALSMGVPLVAIRGQTMAARMSASIVKGLGRPEWICNTEEDFASAVAILCSDLDALRSGKKRLQAEVLASQLFDGKDLTRHLESAFLEMLAIHKSRLDAN